LELVKTRCAAKGAVQRECKIAVREDDLELVKTRCAAKGAVQRDFEIAVERIIWGSSAEH
jgi:hypothetical protein